MAFNQIQFQHGVSIPEFPRCLGTGGAVRGGGQAIAMAGWIPLPALRRRRSLRARRGCAALCRSVWNLTSHMVCGDACGQGHGWQEGRGRQMRELSQT